MKVTAEYKHTNQVYKVKPSNIFSSNNIYPKLTINEPNDKYEKQADRVAEQVMRMLELKVQMQCLECEEERPLQPKPISERITALVQRQVEEEEEEEPIQTKSNNGVGMQVSFALQRQLQTSKGGGSPLPFHTNHFMSRSIGSDFSNVRVHTDAQANQMNESIQARAFTHGSDIYFKNGKYNPGSSTGKHLLAHELTHVLQQKGETKNKVHSTHLLSTKSLPVSTKLDSCIQRASQIYKGISYFDNKKEAVDHVPKYIVPSDCFVMYTTVREHPPGFPWRVVGKYGCAHWVAHQLGIKADLACCEGYAIRRIQIISKLRHTEHSLADAKAGDIWLHGTHSGIVRAVNKSLFGSIISVMVEHDSDRGEIGVITSEMSEGRFYTNPNLLDKTKPRKHPVFISGTIGPVTSTTGQSMSFGSAMAMYQDHLSQFANSLGSLDENSLNQIVESAEQIIGEAQDKLGLVEWINDTATKLKDEVKKKSVGENLLKKKNLSECEQAYKQARAKGLHVEKTIQNAMNKGRRPKIRFARWMGLLKYAGKALMAVGIALVGIRILLKPEAQRAKSIFTEVGRIGGAMIFGGAGAVLGKKLGSVVGAAIGSVIGGPMGAAIGIVIGSALGSLLLGIVLSGLGDMAGEKLTEWLYDRFAPSNWRVDGEYQTGER